MASLTSVAITTRKAVRYGIYFIIFLIIARISLGLIVGILQKVFPPAPAVPTVQFGKLPQLPFQLGNVTSPLTYTIQTPEGGLPILQTQAKVYFMPQPHSNLLALDDTKAIATSLGFTSAPVQITPTTYDFTDANNLSTLEMNIITKQFYIAFKLNQDPSPLSQIPPSANAAAATAKSFLQSASLLPDDLTGPVTQEYLKVQNQQLVSAISQSEANLIRINLFRKDYDKLPSLTESPDKANVWFIISGAQNQNKQIIQVQYYYSPVDETQFATYPLKTADEAFKELQSGKGFIANQGSNPEGKITIRRVYLAYYDSSKSMQFYQPIVAFEGDNGFVAYVPAITSNYYAQ